LYGDRTLWKLPRRLPYPTSVAFGKPMPATSTAAEVRQAVQQLAAGCAVARSNRCRAIPREFIRTVARHPFRPCVIEPHSPTVPVGTKVHKYFNVLARTMELRRKLCREIDDASIVATFLPPGFHFVITNLAIAFCGKAVLNLDPHASPESIRAKLAECRVTRLLTTARYLIAHPLPAALGAELIDIEHLLGDVSFIRRFFTNFAAVVLPGWLLDHWVLRRSGQKLDDLAAIVYTRGRTGSPKPVMLSHRNLVASVSALVRTLDPLPRDRLPSTLPLSDCTGFVCGLWAPLSIGASTVFPGSEQPPALFSPSAPSPLAGEGRGEGAARPTEPRTRTSDRTSATAPARQFTDDRIVKHQGSTAPHCDTLSGNVRVPCAI
jgi:acyl-[acyl-carrier-protein]-phospholipid O-acyltransferase/long-chain-fatty-acid--[acyl-carrier-protein] ligase